MQPKALRNKPLVEAILEVRWALEEKSPGVKSDRHYRILTGRIFDKIHERYPEYEALPTAQIPDELVGHVVQHRFRVGPRRWPVIQLGPGIQTLNSTEEYTWEDFRTRGIESIRLLYDAHPEPSELTIENLTLRYIDAVDFDYTRGDVSAFLRDELKVKTELPQTLFEDAAIQRFPSQFRWESTYECTDPQGRVQMRFATGMRKNSPAVIWETAFESTGAEVPEMPGAGDLWIAGAHRIIEDWFFKLIEGDRARGFSGE